MHIIYNIHIHTHTSDRIKGRKGLQAKYSIMCTFNESYVSTLIDRLIHVKTVHAYTVYVLCV